MAAGQHAHGEESASPPVPFGGRRPLPESIINVLNKRLDQRKEDVRALEDREVFNVALINDLIGQTETQAVMLQQVQTENAILRTRLGLPTTGALELTDEEAASAAGMGADVVESDLAPEALSASEAASPAASPAVSVSESSETSVPDDEPKPRPGVEAEG